MSNRELSIGERVTLAHLGRYDEHTQVGTVDEIEPPDFIYAVRFGGEPLYWVKWDRAGRTPHQAKDLALAWGLVE